MTYFKQTFALTEEEKRQVSEMSGNIMLWIMEGRSIWYMAEKLKLEPWQVEQNINETLYLLRKQVGKWRFFKTLFVK